MTLQATMQDFSIEVDSGKCAMPSMHYHKTYELYYLDAGSREYFIEDMLFPVSAGDFVLIPPDKLHRTGGEYGVRHLINFSRPFLETVYTAKTVDFLLICFDRRLLTPDRDQQTVCLYQMKKMLNSADDTERAISLGALLMELTKCKGRELVKDNVSSIVAYINDNYHQIHNIEQIAAEFYISKFHLCRIFKGAMKMTVIEYLNQVKIRQACHLLTNSLKDIGEISHLCGFHSAAYFSKVFRKMMDQSPLEYRRNG